MNKKTLFTRGLLLLFLAVMPAWGFAQTFKVPYLCIEQYDGEVIKVPITDSSPIFGHSSIQNAEGKEVRCLYVQYRGTTLRIPCRAIKQLTTKFETVDNELGDANLDGMVSRADVIAIANHIIGENPIYSGTPFYSTLADVNRDNKVDVTDITALIKLLKARNGARSAVKSAPRQEPDYSYIASDEYVGQLMNITLTSGKTLYAELAMSTPTPRYENGNVVWILDIASKRQYKLTDVKSISFPSPEQTLADTRQALIAFYSATDGDHWGNNTNWCSDKPLDQWHGVDMADRPYVRALTLEGNGLKGSMPGNDVFRKMGPISVLNLDNNELTGDIPAEAWKQNTALQTIRLWNNRLTGQIPEEIFSFPSFRTLNVEDNRLTGQIPAGLAKLMDEPNAVEISGNDFSGKVPDAVVNHPRFQVEWNKIIPQSGHLTLPDIPGYRLQVTDLDGNRFNTTDIYKDNIYTLIFNYSSARGGFTDMLKTAYDTYKSKGLEVLGMAPGHAEVVNDYLHQNNITWLNLDPESFRNAISHYYIYLNFINLVDQHGNVVFTSIMDDTGKKESTWGESERDQEVFNVLAKKFGQVDFTPYSSTDYSRDGEVITLQRATVGLGVDIVFVGNCFVDKDMAPGGLYETKMREAMEQFFAYEPYTSLRNRFNVYAVKAVSKNAELYEDCQQAIETDADAFNYASKVTTLITGRPMRVNVIYNAINAGRSFTRSFHKDHSYVAFMFTGVNRTLVHEAGGHGVGRLYDEYVEQAGSTATQATKDYYEQMWTDYGYGANIDIHSDLTKTRWARLATDSRYAAESLGAYEGSGTVQYGIYRPTQNSMMRFNDTPFNAPSREAIYKYVMQESEGPTWKYDYETFVAFDAKGREEFAAAFANASRGTTPAPNEVDEKTLPLPPVFVNGTWQDAMKNPTKIVYRH